MKTFSRFLRQPEIPVLLFLLCLVVFTWNVPVLQDTSAGYGGFSRLYVAWALVIVILYLIRRAFSGIKDDEDDDV